MTRIAIMQPTYLSWCGYYALMDQVDQFVLLDDVQFSRQSWQQRNRVKTANGTAWLTVPVYHTGSRQIINQAEICQQTEWKNKHLKTLEYAYGSAPYWNEHAAWIESVYHTNWNKLCDLNSATIKELAEVLGIATSLCYSSKLNAGVGKTSRLVDICQCLGADEYLSPIGSYDYIESDNRFPDAGIRLLYLHFEHPVYQQLHGKFVSHLSTIDLLFNEGPRSLEIIRSGEKTPYTQEDLSNGR